MARGIGFGAIVPPAEIFAIRAIRVVIIEIRDGDFGAGVDAIFLRVISIAKIGVDGDLDGFDRSDGIASPLIEIRAIDLAPLLARGSIGIDPADVSSPDVIEDAALFVEKLGQKLARMV